MGTVPIEAIRRQIIALIPAYMNVFMMGATIGWLPNAIYFFMKGDEVYATSFQCSLMASFTELGRVVFAIPAGILIDKYGRRKITIGVAFLHFFTWLALSLDTSLITIYIGRFILGLAIALINSTALISIGEIASPEIRGQLTSIFQIFMNSGIILPSVISVIFSYYKSLAWGITIFSIISLLPMLWISETPSFLVSVSKLEQARNNLQYIRQGYNKNEIDIEFKKLEEYIEEEKARKSELSWLKFLKTKAIRKPLLIGTLLNTFSILTGGVITGVYVTAVYPSNEYVPKKFYPLITQVMYLFTAISTTFYIEKFPRRSIFMVGAAAMVVINAVCAFSSYSNVDDENNGYVFKWIFICANILAFMCYAASVQPMNNALKSELYPQAVKGFCGSLGIIGQASSMILMYQLFNFFRDHFHIYFIYIIFSLCSLVLYLAIRFLLPEGRGTFLTDLQMKFKQNPTPTDSPNVETGKNDQK